MVEEYTPIDIRKVRGKNRITMSDDLQDALGNPERIVFSVVGREREDNGDMEIKILVNNPNDVQGEQIGESGIDGLNRCVIPKNVYDRVGLSRRGHPFIGFFRVSNLSSARQNDYDYYIEIARVAPMRTNEVDKNE